MAKRGRPAKKMLERQGLFDFGGLKQSIISDFTDSVIVCAEKTKKQKRPRWWEMIGV